MTGRPAIPASIKRSVLIEAGHRCAIPTCRYPTTEIAHIIAYAESANHTPSNLIALCPNCHTRYDKGEIEQISMTEYNNKLIYLSDRYSHYELTVLHALRDRATILVHGELLVKTLLDEALIRIERRLQEITFADGYTVLVTMLVELTASGRALLASWEYPHDHSLSYDEKTA